jgi:hypothetical protein
MDLAEVATGDGDHGTGPVARSTGATSASSDRRLVRAPPPPPFTTTTPWLEDLQASMRRSMCSLASGGPPAAPMPPALPGSSVSPRPANALPPERKRERWRVKRRGGLVMLCGTLEPKSQNQVTKPKTKSNPGQSKTEPTLESGTQPVKGTCGATRGAPNPGSLVLLGDD